MELANEVIGAERWKKKKSKTRRVVSSCWGHCSVLGAPRAESWLKKEVIAPRENVD